MRSEREPYIRFEVFEDRTANIIEFFKITPNRIQTCEIYVSTLPKSTYTVATLLDIDTFSVIIIHEDDMAKVKEMIKSERDLAKGIRGIIRMNAARFSKEFKAERKKVRSRK